MALSELKAELQLLRSRWRVFPAKDAEEMNRRECEENILLVQLECEAMKEMFRREFALTKKVVVEEEVNGERKSKTVSAFNWEPFRDLVYKQIDKKQIERIAHYQEQYNSPAPNATPPKNEQTKV